MAATVTVPGERTGGRFSVVRSRLAPGDATHRHVHRWDDELVVVLRGEVAVLLDGTWRRAPVATVTFLPRGLEHAVVATAPDTEVLTVLAPAGYEQHHAVGPRDAASDDPGRPDLDRLIATAAHFGCELTGPPPSQPAHLP